MLWCMARKKARRGPGRPPGSGALPPKERRSIELRVLVTEDEAEQLYAAAERAGETFSSWARARLLAR